ncbi:MAG: hypothetical protein VYE22_05655 [Myxococcota bacterium]|nr:hypothetical protein [Myxococcota bacterium]
MRALLVALLLVACGGAPRGPRGAGETTALEGRVTYDARHPTPRGASEAIEVRPARHVDLAVLDAGGRVLAEGRTDADGRFALDAPGEATTVRVFARVRVRGHDAAIARDANGAETHALDAPIEGDGALAIHARDQDGEAGAFHVVDTMLRGLDAVQGWTEVTLPPVFAYWVRGGTREWSFYRGERPAGSGRFALELLGGDPGQASISDTDEHDEAIILHELGHFVMDRLSSDSSTGGTHPRGVRVDPGLAWEEGRATWFALAVLGAPLYQDTIGVEPWGRLRVDAELESEEDEVAGYGSETSVSKILWDLSDGDGVLPDADGDGVALGPAVILRAMAAHAEEPGVFPSLVSFLRFLVSEEIVTREALAAMLTRTGEPTAELLPEGPLPWPRPVAFGDVIEGTIDGISQPAPSGGGNIAISGFDAIHSFLIDVTEPGMIVARLTIDGTGSPQERSDLDLQLLDHDADPIAVSSLTGPDERLSHLVQPGVYVLRVRDAGRGNRAAYRLEVLFETLGGRPIAR